MTLPFVADFLVIGLIVYYSVCCLTVRRRLQLPVLQPLGRLFTVATGF